MKRLFHIHPRLLLAIVFACAVIFVPFAHSAGLAHAAHAPMSHDHLHHDLAHGDAAAHDCAHADESAPAQELPSSDPCSMCQSHPICHILVLPEEPVALPAPGFDGVAIGQFPRPAIRTFEPALGPPRA